MPENEDAQGPSRALTTTAGPRAQDQKPEPPGTVIVGTTPIDESRLGALLEERADSRTVSQFAVAAFQDQREENRRLADRLERERERADELAASLARATTEIEVLKTEIREVKKRRRLKSWLFGLGGVVAGVGLDTAWHVEHTAIGYGGLLFLVGAVMLGLGLPAITGEE